MPAHKELVRASGCATCETQTAAADNQRASLGRLLDLDTHETVAVLAIGRTGSSRRASSAGG